MFGRHPQITSFWILVVALATCGSAWAQSGAARAAPRRIALLIGVQDYAKLGPTERLEGARQDVALMRRLLEQRFGFQDSDITTLVDAQATSQGIRAAFRGLEQAVQSLPPAGPPAQVVVHFSGHGSQVPDQPAGSPGHDEPDGLDETLVPFDATRQGGDEDIRDDELNALLQALGRGNKARVWVVLDCCHSGTGTRGTTRVRQLARDVAPTPPGPDGPPEEAKLPPGAIVLGACRADELEPEFADRDQHSGLLTRQVTQILSRERSLSGLSYERMRDAILLSYRSEVPGAPTPQLEAGDPALARAAVLGAGAEADRAPYWPVQAVEGDDQSLRLAAGSVQGVTPGSLFEVYAHPEEIGDQGESVCWLRIEQVDALGAEGRAFGWEDAKRTRPRDDFALPKEFRAGFAVERRRGASASALKLRVVRSAAGAGDGPPVRPAQSSDEPLSALAGALTAGREDDEPPWLTIATEPSEPVDLVLRADGSFAALFPATGVAAAELPSGPRDESIPRSLRGGWGPFDLRADDTPAQVRSALLRIGRARNLLRMAAPEAAPDESRPRASATLVRINEAGVREDVAPSADGSIGLPERVRYAVRVRNETPGKTIYATCLVVSPDMGVRIVLPAQPGDEDGSKLEPGEVKEGRTGTVKGAGRRHVVCIVTTRPLDLSFLQQTDLPRTRSAPPHGPGAALLGRLRQGMFLQEAGTTRGAGDTGDEPWAVSLVSFDGGAGGGNRRENP